MNAKREIQATVDMPSGDLSYIRIRVRRRGEIDSVVANGIGPSGHLLWGVVSNDRLTEDPDASHPLLSLDEDVAEAIMKALVGHFIGRGQPTLLPGQPVMEYMPIPPTFEQELIAKLVDTLADVTRSLAEE
jgi:hypothetical protein